MLSLPLLSLQAQNRYETAAEADKAVIVKVNTDAEPIEQGKYKPTWQSMADYQCPAWFQDAKFGIWAHWGPQCQPEYGDWFARLMYEENGSQYRFSKESRAPQKDFGFKDWINEWKADQWEPEKLVKLYKDCGAKYFFAMANHHDNFDLWNSKYQPWNSVNLGPKKDIVAGWAAAARKEQMPFGLSVHAAHAWTFYEYAVRADTKGTFKGQTYDGRLTKADGKNTWWEGYDPQDLYEQRHTPSKDNGEWDWDTTKVTLPDQAYVDRFYNRTMDLINQFSPDLLYFDDTALPLYPFSDAGLQLLAHAYNKSIHKHGGRNEMVVTGKVLKPFHKQAMVWDVERGTPSDIQQKPWQTCTCIGQWHYDKRVFYNGSYKSAETVVQILADVVSKNGNLLLNVPVKGNGSIDSLEYKIVKKVGDWLHTNGEAIYGTRPWTHFGEGPSVDQNNPMKQQGFNEGKLTYSTSDFRFTKKGKAVYAILMTNVGGGQRVCLKTVGKPKQISLLGFGKLTFKHTAQGIQITLPERTEAWMLPAFKLVY